MAQMPASYLAEKIDDLRVGLVRLNDIPNGGIIDLDDNNRRILADMKLKAQAIVDEIAGWTES